jgi:hypothetical protein
MRLIKDEPLDDDIIDFDFNPAIAFEPSAPAAPAPAVAVEDSRQIKKRFWIPRIHEHTQFDEASHTYKYDGKEMGTSVSRLVSAAVGESEFEDKTRSEECYYKCRMFAALNSAQRAAAPKRDRDRFARYSHCTSSLEISLMWHKAREFGKAVHKAIQNFYTGLPIDPVIAATKSFQSFLKFDASWSKLAEPVACEVVMALEEINCGGSIDMLYRSKKTGVYMVVDWKTTLEDDYGADMRCNRPFDHLPATKETKACLQTNFYAEMFEQLASTDAEPIRNTVCYVVYLRETSDMFDVKTVKRDPSVGLFFAERKVQLAALQRMQHQEPLLPFMSQRQESLQRSMSVDIVERGKHAALYLDRLYQQTSTLLATRSDSTTAIAHRMCAMVERVVSGCVENLVAIERGEALPFPDLAACDAFPAHVANPTLSVVGGRRYHEMFVPPPPQPLAGHPGSDMAEDVDSEEVD